MNPDYMDSGTKFSNHFNMNVEWFELYGDVKEDIMYNTPSAYRKPVDITIYVDAEHANENITRRSHIGILIFFHSAPTMWYSKQQDTINSSNSWSGVVSLGTDIYIIKIMRYNL